jgi:hypothetical protein
MLLSGRVITLQIIRKNQRGKAGKRKYYPAKYAPDARKEANRKAFLAKGKGFLLLAKEKT